MSDRLDPGRAGMHPNAVSESFLRESAMVCHKRSGALLFLVAPD